MRYSRPLVILLALVVATTLGGCRSVGPKTIPKDQFDYSTAIGDSWKRQMLLNIVKMRYGEPPIFLEVASVINQYSLEGSVNVGGNFNGGLTGKDVYGVGGNAKYADRPTITYNPLSGDKFTKIRSSLVTGPILLFGSPHDRSTGSETMSAHPHFSADPILSGGHFFPPSPDSSAANRSACASKLAGAEHRQPCSSKTTWMTPSARISSSSGGPWVSIRA